MSWEAWGTPPDPELAYCPVCGSTSHVEGCELGVMQQRALKAEAALAATIQQATEPRVTRIDFAPGHEDARMTSEQVAAPMRKVRLAPRMLAALKAMDEAMCSMHDGMSKAERHAARLALIECRAVVAEVEGRSPQEAAA